MIKSTNETTAKPVRKEVTFTAQLSTTPSETIVKIDCPVIGGEISLNNSFTSSLDLYNYVTSVFAGLLAGFNTPVKDFSPDRLAIYEKHGR